MPGQRNIETGLDRLVELINTKKRISLDEASKELGVSPDIVKEWADFLEDENLITLEEKLSKTFLCERKLNKKEVEKKAVEYSSKKDAFTRRVEMALSSLQKESEGLDRIKVEFEKLKEIIGKDINEVRGELQELRHYEELKKNIDKEMMQQKADYYAMLEGVKKKMEEERKHYEDFANSITGEKAKIEEARVELSYLDKKEENLQKRIYALREILKSVENEIASQRKAIAGSVATINSKVKDSEKYKQNMIMTLDREMAPLHKNLKDNKEKIDEVMSSVLKKVLERKKSIEKYQFESTQAAEKFKSFFDKKAKTEELIGSLEKEKKELEKSMQDLIRKARSFNLSIKSSDVKNYVKELEESLKNIDKKKVGFIQKLGELTDLISGKN